ncbi:MAG: mannitol-phosphate 5-dehydrogenase [Candidatus Hydrogenedentota bacterium]|jgi:mannitol-1-phosphate 5-dehydrogenase
MSGGNTFVGFGFGAIQAGLFLYEAHRTGRFSRLVAAEVQPEVLEALRGAGNRFSVNIAHADRIEVAEVGPVELLNPNDDGDREQLIEAIAEASEMATALPSVAFYASSHPGAPHALLAEGLARKSLRRLPPAVLYAAENHNHAAEILGRQVEHNNPDYADRCQFLNTVIGKMSGIVPLSGNTNPSLAPIAPGLDRAFLVETFNRILVSAVTLRFGGNPIRRCIDVFEEKPDLLPFEEAKLYGHNAIHAMGGYLASLLDMTTFDQLTSRPDLMALLRDAFVEESGAALVTKYAGKDALFTRDGFAFYADDLLQRMTNPYLGDAIERVTRDTARKLGWDDRLIGAMRVARSQGFTPTRLALGAAAALCTIDTGFAARPEDGTSWLRQHFPSEIRDAIECQQILHTVGDALKKIDAWRADTRNSLMA